jgi:hypothetical protein
MSFGLGLAEVAKGWLAASAFCCKLLQIFEMKNSFRKIFGCSGSGWAFGLLLAGLVHTSMSAATVTLTPVADTYVSSSASGTVQGAATNFITNLGSSNKRWTYLRFDLSGMDVTNLVQAKLELWNTGQGGTFTPAHIYNVYGLLNANDNWTEGALTWNSDLNQSGSALLKANTYGGAELANFSSLGAASTSQIWETAFNVTNGSAINFIKSSSGNLAKVTFVIYEDATVNTSGNAWASKENATASHWPVLTLSTTVTPPTTNSSPQIIKVFLQGGQSNSDGRAPSNGLPANLVAPQPDVPLYYYLTGGAANGDGTLGTLTTLRPGCSAQGSGTYFGPEVTFGRTLADYIAQTNGVPTNTVLVAIIKYAHGGTSLAVNWAANGNNTTNGDGADYVYFQRVVKDGLARLKTAYPGTAIQLEGMTWVQGESDIDAGTAASAAYGTNLVRFINDVRLTYATNQPYGTNLPFFLSRISDNQTVYSNPADPDFPNYLLLRAGQAYAASSMSNVFMTDTDGSQFVMKTDYLHFDTAGQQAMGIAFARALIAAQPRSQLRAVSKSAANFRVNINGIPGLNHSLERAASLDGPWSVLTNIIMGTVGNVEYDDAALPLRQAFYRASRL